MNDDADNNLLNRKFHWKIPLEVIITDLIYVRVKQSWHYICLIVDLYNHEIVGYNSGSKKNARKAFFTQTEEVNLITS